MVATENRMSRIDEIVNNAISYECIFGFVETAFQMGYAREWKIEEQTCYITMMEKDFIKILAESCQSEKLYTYFTNILVKNLDKILETRLVLDNEIHTTYNKKKQEIVTYREIIDENGEKRLVQKRINMVPVYDTCENLIYRDKASYQEIYMILNGFLVKNFYGFARY